MADNRLYIVDTETGDELELAKTFAMEGWTIPFLDWTSMFHEWVKDRDTLALTGGGHTNLILVTEKDPRYKEKRKPLSAKQLEDAEDECNNSERT